MTKWRSTVRGPTLLPRMVNKFILRGRTEITFLNQQPRVEGKQKQNRLRGLPFPAKCNPSRAALRARRVDKLIYMVQNQNYYCAESLNHR
jgi:hypothetical protein